MKWFRKKRKLSLEEKTDLWRFLLSLINNEEFLASVNNWLGRAIEASDRFTEEVMKLDKKEDKEK